MSKDEKKSPNKNNENLEKRSSLDKFEEQKMVDDIPMEDLKIEMKDEKKKFKSKNSSESERKHKTNNEE
ncbi:hypothetical protein [Virgibacillus ainsalahensis]